MPQPACPITADALASVAELAAAIVADEQPSAPAVLRVRCVAEEVELGWLPLDDGDHPLDALVGAHAPDDWAAAGVTATGRLHRLDDGGGPPVPVRTAHLVGRDGSWASWWQPEGGGAEASVVAGPADDPARPEGRIDDACRLVLGLATAPPAVTTDELWRLQWLDRVVGAAGGRRRPDWAAVAALHPAAEALVGGGDVPSPARLAVLARRLARLRGWGDLRRAAAAGTWEAPGVGAPTAAWLDDGAFSRWVLGGFPELVDLRTMAAALLAPSVADAVAATLVPP